MRLHAIQALRDAGLPPANTLGRRCTTLERICCVECLSVHDESPRVSLGLTAARIEAAGTVNARLIDGGRLSHGGDVLLAAVVTQGARGLKLR